MRNKIPFGKMLLSVKQYNTLYNKDRKFQSDQYFLWILIFLVCSVKYSKHVMHFYQDECQRGSRVESCWPKRKRSRES